MLALTGLILISGWFAPSITRLIEIAIKKQLNLNWPSTLQFGGWIIFLAGALLAVAPIAQDKVAVGLMALKAALKTSDAWLETKLSGTLNLATPRNPPHAGTGTTLQWPIVLQRSDWVAVSVFTLLALISQVSSSSAGFPNVILGGDAANIASFAAGRAYPQLFSGDAILGDLNNIGLYTTIHLPITIFLEKLVGNFGLAYSLLVFPHVFLQYFSYYLLGRVIFKNRYWAFLFTLAVSAPMYLAGGEVWGVVGDGMPRITFQVLIPFLLILLLTTWRDRPRRWLWVMVIAGLMAFIHPVSTPAWAFALWLGMWPNMPSYFALKDKLLQMFKMGVVLVLALLPYVSIYLYFHKSSSSASDYELVYYILTNFFPYDLLSIPAALNTLFKVTSQYGLFWYGLFGLILTFLLFRSERGRLKQMLFWIIGISFVTVLVPWVEHSLERALRIIPIETELMRGMRYLVPFLFIFWFYPLAELTNRGLKSNITRTVFAVGTALTLVFLFFDTPLPFTSVPDVVTCWTQGHIICPTDSDYADALTFIHDQTPENAKFVVFLTNRWSGIEVRYLGLRPMAYAFKDRGQLAFTNLEALQTWYYYEKRESAIFSRNVSPTIDSQRTRMIDFAKDAEANFLLTDFPFPPDVQKSLRVTAIYQNSGFTILKIYEMRQ